MPSYCICGLFRLPPQRVQRGTELSRKRLRKDIGARRAIWKIIVLLALLAATILGQGRASKTDLAIPTRVTVPKTPFHVKVDSNLMQIYVTVADKENRTVQGLVRDDFRVYEDGVEQKITHFGIEEGPVSVCLIFDASWSMMTKLNKAIEATRHLLDGIRRDDEYCLVRFSDRPQLAAGLSKYPRQIKESIKATRLGGATALYDAVLAGMSEIERAANSHKALILVSDGGDNNSRHTEGQIDEAVGQGDVQIYAIALPAGDYEGIRGYRLLQRLSDQSGGQTFRIDAVQELPGVVRKINLSIRHRYELGYYVTESHPDGEYRHVTIKLRSSTVLQGLHAYARPGYYKSRD